MSVTLTSRDVRLLRKTLETLLTPISHSSPEEWGLAVLAEVKELLRADQALFALPFDGSVHLSGIGSRASDAIQSYEKYYWQVDNVIGVKRRALGLEVHHQDDFYTPEDLRTDVLFNEWCRPNELFDTLGLAVDVSSAAIPGGINVYHCAPSRPFGARGRALMEILLPAFKASVNSYRELLRLRDSVTDAIDALPTAAVLVGSDASVLHRNNAMKCLDSAPRLQYAIMQTVADIASELAKPTAGTNSNCYRDVSFAGSRYEVRGSRIQLSSFPNVVGVVFVSALRMEEPKRLNDLRLQYGLTRREHDFLPFLSQRLSVTEIAEHLGMSSHTARHHVESIYRKVGVRRRKDLLRLLSSETAESV